MGCVPFDVLLRNRNVAGDFHRPYENSESFTFHHLTGCLRNRSFSGDFHRPYGGSFRHATYRPGVVLFYFFSWKYI